MKITERRIAKWLGAASVFLSAFSLSLPDSTAGSPQLIVGKLGIALGLMAVYLGAPKPEVK